MNEWRDAGLVSVCTHNVKVWFDKPAFPCHMSATRKCHFIGEPSGVLVSERLFLHSQMENYGEHDADSNDNKNYELKRFGILI